MKSSARQDSPFRGFASSVLRAGMAPAETGGIAIALVAAHPHAGTTHLTALLTKELTLETQRTISLNCRELLGQVSPGAAGPGAAAPLAERADGVVSGSQDRTARERDDRRSGDVAKLRASYDYAFIDCPSLKESQDVVGLASYVDGILLVIEANRTTKSQISYLEQAVQRANGKILGHLLNKRTYPIPERVHAKLEDWGL